MRSLYRTSAVSAMLVALICGVAVSQAQVNGNATVSASDISVSTSSKFAGAVSSIKWKGKEYINNWDHGRQLQTNMQFFERYCCYNPYEAGSFEDARSSTSTSKLLSLSASGNRLETTTQMAWNYREFNLTPGPTDFCGDPARWMPIVFYTQPLSNYRAHKTVTIGFAGIPNVIEYLIEEFI